MDEKKVFSLVVAIVNRGFSDDVMDAAREAGAKGGTVVYAHGAGQNETETFFGISIHPEKELVLILAEDSRRTDIMQAIVRRTGLTTEGRGLTFSLPVSGVSGISNLTEPIMRDE